MDKVLNDFTNKDEILNIFYEAGTVIVRLIIIYVLYLIIKAVGHKMIHTIFERYQAREKVSSSRAKTLEKLIKNTFDYILLFIIIVTALQMIGIHVTAILAGAGIIGLAIGFGAQGLVSDVVTGFFLLLEKQVDVDDYITTGNFSGIVEQMGLRTTQIRDFDGTLHFIPNRQIITLSNHSRGNMRALVDISISNEEDPDKMIDIIQTACIEAVKGNLDVVEGPNVVGVEAFDSKEIVIRVLAKTKNGKQWEVERILKKAIANVLTKRVKESN
ncbi:mechanosensitive ion channel family protein [Heyndrickxia ginsengihumi]|uniref:mechanosensitive ion channel family protein n=1 Tax=Heyndrickxia ginsengihumi TaxID=363870 RepID=UPI00046F8A5D|nr:mechanosensitive ion channel family protein [Heyndrickxia ginsengihumi]MCM3022350.1 mechanosensitive ion channel family protein [Heyndrickxia ginsengihumi]